MGPDLIACWYSALGERFGIVIQTDDRERLRQQLYQARAKVGDPDLEALSIVFSPTIESELWIIRKTESKDVTS